VYNQYVSVNKNGKTAVAKFEKADVCVRSITGKADVCVRSITGKADVCVRSITGKTSSQERREIFDWFQADVDEIRVLCNVGTIKEGVDLPCIDLIAFCDEKHSRIDII
jgi:superfamily II DNA or RNA helicase